MMAMNPAAAMWANGIEGSALGGSGGGQHHGVHVPSPSVGESGTTTSCGSGEMSMDGMGIGVAKAISYFLSEVVNGEKVKKVTKKSSEASLIVFWGFLMLTGLKTSL